MAKLGAGVDELEGDLLGEPLLGQCLQGLPITNKYNPGPKGTNNMVAFDSKIMVADFYSKHTFSVVYKVALLYLP